MKSISIIFLLTLFFLVSISTADANPKNIFRGTISKEVYQGHFEGKCGIWLKDFDSMLEIEDENGIKRELFTNKIDSIVINSKGTQGPRITVTIGDRTIKGKFHCITYLVTDTGRIDLSEINPGKTLTLLRAK